MNNKTKTQSTSAHDQDRRRFIKTSAAIAGAAAVVPSVSIAMDSKQAPPVEHLSGRSAQHQYIVDVLNKYAAKSKRIDPAHIEAFARGFIEQNGDQNYRQVFNGVHGEYKLVKLFMKSMNQSFA